jgi:hypothetical protein
MGSIAWRGTFHELQDIIAKSLATKKFPAKPLGGELGLAGNFPPHATLITNALQSPNHPVLATNPGFPARTQVLNSFCRQ